MKKKQRGAKWLWTASSYVILKNGETIYTENSVDYIRERMNSGEKLIWLDIATIISEKVTPFNRDDIVDFGEIRR